MAASSVAVTLITQSPPALRAVTKVVKGYATLLSPANTKEESATEQKSFGTKVTVISLWSVVSVDLTLPLNITVSVE